MLIVGNQGIADVFAIFHDGLVTACQQVDRQYILDVEIEYIATLIDPQFAKFVLFLDNVSLMKLTNPLETLEGTNVFSEMITLLYSRVTSEHVIEVDTTHGLLHIKADSAKVCDESGIEYSVDQLAALSNQYWDRNRRGDSRE
jgi:hypothetical protein